MNLLLILADVIRTLRKMRAQEPPPETMSDRLARAQARVRAAEEDLARAKRADQEARAALRQLGGTA
ncbi:hypothetical protein [Nocardia nova]|uniref:hypothetical protein n=1 Tax=Nocardia nova TaxID=37330 RepID=UPI001894A81A|nr:hypothetical protein [Nocardia nova]MBF6277024.1 hypothetical protein [Nocardia nova]